MLKYLILEFNDAGLFIKHNGDKQFEHQYFLKKNGDNVNRRENLMRFKEPITVYQISNVLHNLFGQRPVPTRKFCFYNKDPYLFDKALESFIKINFYYFEKLTLKKAVYNSWQTSSNFFDWYRIRTFLDEHYEYFISVLQSELNLNPLEKTFYEIADLIKENISKPAIQNLLIFLSKNQKTSLVYDLGYQIKNNQVIPYEQKTTMLNSSPKTTVTIVNGIGEVCKLSGEIVIPVNENDIEIIRNHTGTADILDGGIVYIKKLLSPESINLDNYTPVKNISLEEVKYEN